MKTSVKKTRSFVQTDAVTQDKFISKLIELMNNLTNEKWEVFHKDLKLQLPFNAQSNRNYKGVNVIILLLDMMCNKHALNGYLTFNQIKNLKGNLRKGSQGVPIEFFTSTFKNKETGEVIFENIYNTLSDDEKVDYTKRNIVKMHYVFNISQIDNYEEFKINLMEQIDDKFSDDVNVNFDFETIIENLKNSKGLILEEILQGKAFYQPSTDKVCIPKKELFKSTQEYYSVLFHEITHWTGNKNRLNRPLQGINDRAFYAFEELIAELGTLIINLNNGRLEDFKNSIVYLKGWLSYTQKEGENYQEENLRKAFIEAQKAVSYILY